MLYGKVIGILKGRPNERLWPLVQKNNISYYHTLLIIAPNT